MKALVSRANQLLKESSGSDRVLMTGWMQGEKVVVYG